MQFDARLVQEELVDDGKTLKSRVVAETSIEADDVATATEKAVEHFRKKHPKGIKVPASARTQSSASEVFVFAERKA